MLVLFDNGTPRSLARQLIGQHAVAEARARGWERLGNGELLDAAEAAGFDVLVTTDKNLRYQQNLRGRKLAVVVLGQGRWSLIRRRIAARSFTVKPNAPLARKFTGVGAAASTTFSICSRVLMPGA